MAPPTGRRYHIFGRKPALGPWRATVTRRAVVTREYAGRIPRARQQDAIAVRPASCRRRAHSADGALNRQNHRTDQAGRRRRRRRRRRHWSQGRVQVSRPGTRWAPKRHDGGPVGVGRRGSIGVQVARRCIPVDMGNDEVRNSLCGGTEVGKSTQPIAEGNATIGSAPAWSGRRR
jgi:hypothetical protein